MLQEEIEALPVEVIEAFHVHELESADCIEAPHLFKLSLDHLDLNVEVKFHLEQSC